MGRYHKSLQIYDIIYKLTFAYSKHHIGSKSDMTMIGELDMRKSTKKELWVLFILLLLAIACGMVLRNYTEAKELKAGKQQQADKRNMMKDNDFRSKDLNGNDIVLSEYKGKKVFINFWSLSCRPCIAEMADIEKLYNETKDSDLVILSINVAGTEEKVRSAIAERGYSFPIMLDYEGTITEQYNVLGFPTSFFIDSEGYLDNISVGAITLEKMKKLINDMD
jgi:peroxiredoxin